MVSSMLDTLALTFNHALQMPRRCTLQSSQIRYMDSLSQYRHWPRESITNSCHDLHELQH